VQVGGGPVRVTLYKSGTSGPLPPCPLSAHLPSDTFMNNSGPALARVLRSSGAPSNQLLVLHDALDRAPLSIAPKVRGSAEGHNGVRSAITSLGSDDFRRLRLGIGRSEQQDTAAFVLGALSAAERAHWGDGGRGVDEAWAAIEKVVAEIRGREQKRGARAAESSRTA
jgi:peptidyl-tRNA hydrolase